MKTIKFKTNIKCEGCITAVTPHLKEIETIDQWTVDTNVPEKVLTVTGTEDLTQQVIDKLKKAGYVAELIP